MGMGTMKNCLFIHGIGEQSYREVIEKAVKLRPSNSNLFILYWADVMDAYERAIMYRYDRIGFLDRILIMWFADAIAYANRRDDILNRFLELKLKDEELVIISHSWGTIIALDVIHTFKLTNATLFTLASPLPLYVAKIPSQKGLASVFSFDITVPNKWINIYYKEDIFAFPLRDYSAQDYELSSGFKIPILNRFRSHNEYFGDRRVKKIIEENV